MGFVDHLESLCKGKRFESLCIFSFRKECKDHLRLTEIDPGLQVAKGCLAVNRTESSEGVFERAAQIIGRAYGSPIAPWRTEMALRASLDWICFPNADVFFFSIAMSLRICVFFIHRGGTIGSAALSMALGILCHRPQQSVPVLHSQLWQTNANHLADGRTKSINLTQHCLSKSIDLRSTAQCAVRHFKKHSFGEWPSLSRKSAPSPQRVAEVSISIISVLACKAARWRTFRLL